MVGLVVKNIIDVRISLSFEVVFGELFIVAWLHGLVTLLLPGGWANLTVLVSVFEGLNESDVLIDISSDWEIILSDVSEDALVIDDVGGTKRHTCIGVTLVGL